MIEGWLSKEICDPMNPNCIDMIEKLLFQLRIQNPCNWINQICDKWMFRLPGQHWCDWTIETCPVKEVPWWMLIFGFLTAIGWWIIVILLCQRGPSKSEQASIRRKAADEKYGYKGTPPTTDSIEEWEKYQAEAAEWLKHVQ
jgi:hypothetical protein